MAEANRTYGLAPEPGTLRTLVVALSVAAVCASLVTASVVVLRPYEVENRQRERERRILALVAGLPGLAELVEEAGEAQLGLRVVELATGADAPAVDPEALLLESETDGAGTPLPPERDLAGIGTRPNHAPVYVLEREGVMHTVILPVYGRGYLATIRGYLAVAGDGNTVRGITFTEHQETPGLGAEIDSPVWQARWRGRRLRDDAGAVRIRVVQTPPAAGSPEAAFDVHGISGATRTGDGVSNLVRFWVGPDGFGPYLALLREEEGS